MLPRKMYDLDPGDFFIFLMSLMTAFNILWYYYNEKRLRLLGEIHEELETFKKTATEVMVTYNKLVAENEAEQSFLRAEAQRLITDRKALVDEYYDVGYHLSRSPMMRLIPDWIMPRDSETKTYGVCIIDASNADFVNNRLIIQVDRKKNTVVLGSSDSKETVELQISNLKECKNVIGFL